MGPFEAFYASPAQHPWLLWAAATAGAAAALGRPGLDASVRRYCTFLFGLSAADAWLTSAFVYGIGSLSEPASRFVQLGFVLAGDFRFLLLVFIATPEGALEPTRRRVSAALGLTLVVPILTQLVMWGLGESEPRAMFFIYELAFFALTVALLYRHPRVRSAGWLRPICRFVLLYYGLWAAADAILLATGSDLGFALRVVPNALYYGGLIGAVGWAAAGATR